MINSVPAGKEGRQLGQENWPLDPPRSILVLWVKICLQFESVDLKMSILDLNPVELKESNFTCNGLVTRFLC